MTEPRVIAKLRALLARADETRNDNEHERAIAMRQAQALMDQHNIDIATLDEPDTHEARGETKDTVGAPVWRSQIYASIARLYAVTVYRSGIGRTTVIVMIGAEHNRIACQLMSQYVIRSIEREANKYRGAGRSFLHSFRVGAASGVCKQVSEILVARATAQQTAADGTALVLADYYRNQMALNDEYLRASGIQLQQTRASNPRNAAAYFQGQKYGSSMSLNNQMSGQSGQQLLK